MKRISMYEIERNIVKAEREWKAAKTKEEKEVALKEHRYWISVFYDM